VVLSGRYEEAGDLGRLRVGAGDVILHEAFEAHLDRFPASGVTVLNISLPGHQAFQPGLGSVDDPDSIVRIAEKSETDAAALLVSLIRIRQPQHSDWTDELAAAMLQNPSLSLSRWSREHRIASWSVSRGFAQVFAVTPSAFRARARARCAWDAIRTTGASLATIAADCGFADQSHMTRSVKSVTGKSPYAWRSGCK
jgi:AraC-like DNA-binding protein